MSDFDFIIIGGGASGLLLARAMSRDRFFDACRIGIIEKDLSKSNDRTWCFWEKGEGEFDSLLTQQWGKIVAGDEDSLHPLSIHPYRYKMLEGKHFYKAMHTELKKASHITWITDEVKEVKILGNENLVITKDTTYSARKVFSSFRIPNLPRPGSKHPSLKQHFIGWFVKFVNPVLDATVATFMDFSVPQKNNTRFMYLLPVSSWEVLVEYTLFSADLLDESEYESEIKQYIEQHWPGQAYEIRQKEKGCIPMTSNDFGNADTENFMHIGIAGGWAKPSTGYTFYNAYRNTQRIVTDLKKNGTLPTLKQKPKFWWYDSLLLNILNHENEKGKEIFTTLFQKQDPRLILKFLNEETTIAEDLKIIASCPKTLFLKALWRQISTSG